MRLAPLARNLAFSVAVALVTPSATAQSSDLTLSEMLFQEGKELLKAKRYAEACPKLQESLRLDRATGTLIALAACHEGEGRIATAWAEFAEAAVAAQKDGRPDRIEFARERARALSPQLSRLEIRVPPEALGVVGLEIKRDGVVLGSAVYNASVPVDPGAHAVEATAPGMRPWSSNVQIAGHGEQQVVSIPRLLPIEMRNIEIAHGVTAPSAGGSQRTAGWVVGGAGLVALGVGGYFGLRAIANHDEATSRCSPASCLDPEAVRLNDDARVYANISNVGVGLGLAGLAAGAILVLTAPAQYGGTKTSLWITPGGVGLRMTLR